MHDKEAYNCGWLMRYDQVLSQVQIEVAIPRAYKSDSYLLIVFVKVLCSKIGSERSQLHLVDVPARLVGGEFLQQHMHRLQCCDATFASTTDKPHLLYIPNEGSKLASTR